MFDYIDNATKLNDLLQRLDDAEWVTLDTEFIREKTYYPRLCLIQIASDDVLACIDPLQIDNLQPFFTWLQQPHRLKVLHAAWQDLEIFHYLGKGQVPSPIFDTQIAAAVLGMGDQVGYARLVEGLLNVRLDKSQSRTDWAKRPLSQKQLEYAIDDVRYLRDVYKQLHQKLQQQGRVRWLEKPFQKLTTPQEYQVDVREVWKRVKGVQILKPRQLAILRELAAWREERALHKNIPRRWVVSDEILLDMARMSVRNHKSMRQIRGLSAEQIAQHGDDWLACIEQGRAVLKADWPELPRRRKLDADLNLVAELLMVLVNKVANEHGISAQMIATRQQVEKMLASGRSKLSEDWRGALVNDLFEQVLSGQGVVRVRDHRLELES